MPKVSLALAALLVLCSCASEGPVTQNGFAKRLPRPARGISSVNENEANDADPADPSSAAFFPLMPAATGWASPAN